LTYTWATTGTPPAAVTYSVNGTNAAKNTVATFTKIGTYSFRVTISDPAGLSTTSSVNVTVNATLTSIVISPASVTLNSGGTQQFSAVAYDQFGTSISPQPSFTWSMVSGGGTINSSGLYTAPSSSGSAVVQAASGGITDTAAVNITSAGNVFTNDADIGSPTYTGSYTYSNGTYTVNGGGADIWSTSDQFNYLYKAITGDVTIIARVASLTGTSLNSWPRQA